MRARDVPRCRVQVRELGCRAPVHVVLVFPTHAHVERQHRQATNAHELGGVMQRPTKPPAATVDGLLQGLRHIPAWHVTVTTSDPAPWSGHLRQRACHRLVAQAAWKQKHSKTLSINPPSAAELHHPVQRRHRVMQLLSPLPWTCQKCAICAVQLTDQHPRYVLKLRAMWHG